MFNNIASLDQFTTTTGANFEFKIKPGFSNEIRLRFIVDGEAQDVEKATTNYMARQYRTTVGFIPVAIDGYPDYTGTQSQIVFRGNTALEAVAAYVQMLDNYGFPVIKGEAEVGEKQYGELEGVWISNRECELRTTFSKAIVTSVLTELLPDAGEFDVDIADVTTYRSVQRVRQVVYETQTIVTLSREQAEQLVKVTNGSDNLPGRSLMEKLLEARCATKTDTSATAIVNLVVDGKSRKIRAYRNS